MCSSNCWMYLLKSLKILMTRISSSCSWWSCSQLLANLLYWWPGDLRRLLRCLHYFTLFHKSTTCPFGAIQGRSIREEVFKKFFWKMETEHLFSTFLSGRNKIWINCRDWWITTGPCQTRHQTRRIVQTNHLYFLSLYFLKNYGNCNMFDNVEEKSRQ